MFPLNHFFDNDLLVGILSTFLIPCHIYNCTLVNKQFNRSFTPLLYRAILISKDSHSRLSVDLSSPQSTLSNNLHLTRHLHLDRIKNVKTEWDLTRCRYLLTLIRSFESYLNLHNLDSLDLIRVVHVNPGLRELVLHGLSEKDALFNGKELSSAIFHCKQLAVLDILFLNTISPRTLWGLLQNFPTSLKSVVVSWSSVPSRSESSIIEATADLSKVYKDLQTFRLRGHISQSIFTPLLQFLGQCPSLKTLGTPSVSGIPQDDQDAFIARLRCILPLTVDHVLLDQIYVAQEHLKLALQSCPGGLRKLTLRANCTLNDMGMDTLRSYAVTLQSLDLTGQIYIQNKDVQSIFVHCSGLRRVCIDFCSRYDQQATSMLDVSDVAAGFTVSETRGKGNVAVLDTRKGTEEEEEEEGEDKKEEAPRAWTCFGLKELKIVFSPVNDFKFGAPNPTVQDKRNMIVQTCKQLGAMKQLQVLDIGWYDSRATKIFFVNPDRPSLDLSLEMGLAHLAGLEDLREINMAGLFPCWIKPDAAEWMAGHWPKWTKLVAPTEWNQGKPPTGLGVLKSRRPNLTIEFPDPFKST